jgi:hypothetical protein
LATLGETHIQKPFWTLAKILGLVVVALLVVSVTAFSVLTNLPLLHSGSKACSYGGVFPNCNPASCTNTATHTPSCNNICLNGAPNYPSCTFYSTQTSISCTPVYAYYNSLASENGPFGDDCSATVTDTTTPSGNISWSSPVQWAGNKACTLTASKCTNRVSPTYGVSYPALISLSANYTGDATHKSSISHYNITVPSMVYFTYSASPPRDCGCPDYQVTQTYFRSSDGIQYVGFSDYYSLNLPNMQHYDVNINWVSSVNSGSYGCSLYLYQFSDTANAYFQCV